MAGVIGIKDEADRGIYHARFRFYNVLAPALIATLLAVGWDSYEF